MAAMGGEWWGKLETTVLEQQEKMWEKKRIARVCGSHFKVKGWRVRLVEEYVLSKGSERWVGAGHA